MSSARVLAGAGNAYRHRLQTHGSSAYRTAGQMMPECWVVASGRRSGGALVAVMKPADFGDYDDTPGQGRLALAPTGAVVSEALVRSGHVVVREVSAKHATQVTFIEHDDEVEAFSANRADDAFGEGILPGRAGGDDGLADAQVLHSPLEVSPVDGVAIAEQVGGSGLVGEGVDELLGGPRGGGLVSDAEVD